MIVASPAAAEPTTENLMSHATSYGKPVERATMLTAKQKSRWSGRAVKREAAHSDAVEPEDSKPKAVEPKAIEPEAPEGLSWLV